MPSTHASRSSRGDGPRGERRRDDGALHQSGRFALTGLPGYAGYVPGKVARNVYGSTFRVANERSVHMTRSGLLDSAPPSRSPGLAPGMEIPGYTGFVPGRCAENVLGQSCARGAETAWIIQSHQKDERQQRVASYRRGERPPTGVADYSGYRSLGGPIGVDSAWLD